VAAGANEDLRLLVEAIAKAGKWLDVS
jgi:hypothetical protein